MGEARRRGTFEERKAQAIAQSRTKQKKPKISRGRPENGFNAMPFEMLAAIMMFRHTYQKKEIAMKFTLTVEEGDMEGAVDVRLEFDPPLSSGRDAWDDNTRGVTYVAHAIVKTLNDLGVEVS